MFQKPFIVIYVYFDKNKKKSVKTISDQRKILNSFQIERRVTKNYTLDIIIKEVEKYFFQGFLLINN